MRRYYRLPQLGDGNRMAKRIGLDAAEFAEVTSSFCPSLDFLVKNAVHPIAIKVVVEPGTLDIIIVYLFEDGPPLSLRLTQADIWNTRSQAYEQLAVLAN